MEESDDDDEGAPELVEVPTASAAGAKAERDAAGPVAAIPVTVITGYLGAGKSTLLNYLLRANHGRRIAIIENEFGEGVGVEGMIAKSGLDDSSLEGFFELSNGCICCTVKGDLLTTLEQLVLHKDRFDYIIIETTGVANPGPVISTFWTDESLGSCLRLDGVVCVVDTANLARYLSAPDTANDVQMQISFADRVLLNKSDLAGPAALQAAADTVASINAAAEVQVTNHSQIDPQWVLGIDCYSLRLPALQGGASAWSTDSLLCAPCLPSPASASSSPSLPTQTQAPHSAATLGTVTLIFSGRPDLPRLRVFLDGLLYGNGLAQRQGHGQGLGLGQAQALGSVVNAEFAPHSPQPQTQQIFRIKGVLQPPLLSASLLSSHVSVSHVPLQPPPPPPTPRPPQPVPASSSQDPGPAPGSSTSDSSTNTIQPQPLLILQAVHDIFDIQPAPSFLAGSAADPSGGDNRVVVIGRCLDRPSLLAGFERCFVREP